MFDYRLHEFERVIQVLDPQHEGYGQKPSCMVNYLESHDEERIALALKRAGCDEHTAVRAALGATVLFTVAGSPCCIRARTGASEPQEHGPQLHRVGTVDNPGGEGFATTTGVSRGCAGATGHCEPPTSRLTSSTRSAVRRVSPVGGLGGRGYRGGEFRRSTAARGSASRGRGLKRVLHGRGHPGLSEPRRGNWVPGPRRSSCGSPASCL